MSNKNRTAGTAANKKAAQGPVNGPDAASVDNADAAKAKEERDALEAAAKELEVSFDEKTSNDDLKAAINEKSEEIAKQAALRTELEATAKKLEVSFDENTSNDDLKAAINEKSEEIAKQAALRTELEATAKKLEVSFDENTSNDDLKSAIKEKSEEIANKQNTEPAPLKVAAKTNLTIERQRKAKAEQKKRAIKLAEDAAKKGEKSPVSEKETVITERKSFKNYKGLRYRFKVSAPKTLNIDGVSTPISEIIENKEIMEQLIAGNSNFIEPIH